jgi:glycine hydroxymethyltransferase
MIKNISDQVLFDLVEKESQRQATEWNLIPSENYTYPEVHALCGSVLANKYAEGVPGKRFYEGCRYIDEIEILAQERAKELFGASYANVTPHSGANANLIAYFALLQKGDLVLAMDFSCGGHLTHGHPKNISSALFQFIFYGVVPETGEIDYDQIEALCHEYRPKLIISGASSYSLLIDYQRVDAIAKKYGALHLADMAHIAGLVAAGVIPSPVPYADVVTFTTHKTLRGPRGAVILCRPEFERKITMAAMPGVQGGPHMNMIAAKAWIFGQAKTEEYRLYQKEVLENASCMVDQLRQLGMKIVSGKTENHLCVVDLSELEISGHQVAKILSQKGIAVNQNTVPYDKKGFFETSGIRLGSPFITALGKTKAEIREKMTELVGIVKQSKII